MAIAEASTDADRIVVDVRKALVEKAVGDVHRAVGKKFPAQRVSVGLKLKAGQASLVGAFLLSCCAIEAAGHFLSGTSESRRSFETFASKYLGNRYEPTVLYKALRCGLAHSYSLASDNANLRERYDLTHNDSLAHLRADDGDPYIRYINLQNFIVDVTDGIENFMTDVANNLNHEQFWFLHYAESAGWLNEFVAATAPATGTAATVAVPPVPRPPWTPATIPFPALWNSTIQPGVTTGKLTGATYDINPLPPGEPIPPGGLRTFTVTGSGHTTPADLGVSGTLFTPTTATRKITIPPNYYASQPANNQKRLERERQRKRKFR